MQIHKRLIATVLSLGLLFAGTSVALAHEHERGGGSMMQQGQGEGMGMMGKGQGQGQQMMHKGMMHKCMKGHGMGHGGMMGGFQKLLSVEDVNERIQKWLDAHLGERVKVGAIEVRGDFSIGAEITTADGSLVQRLVVDRRNGKIWRAE